MVCLYVCRSVGHVREPCETAKPILMPFREAESCGPKEQCIRWGDGWTNPFADARGDKTAMRPFVRIL